MENTDQENTRNKLIEDVLDAWAHYRGTGLHATQEEADAWLAKLASGEDAEPPACHR